MERRLARADLLDAGEQLAHDLPGPVLVGGGEVEVDRGGVEGLVAEVLGDEAQTHPLFEQMGGEAVAQGMHGDLGAQAHFGPGQAEGVLDGRGRKVAVGRGQVLVPVVDDIAPGSADGGEDPLGMSVSAPEVAQQLEHGRRDGHAAVLASLGGAHVHHAPAARKIGDPQRDGLADAQAAVIDQGQAGTEAGLAQGLQEPADFVLGEDLREGLGPADAQVGKDPPLAAQAEVLGEEEAQGAAQDAEGHRPVPAGLSDLQEEGADLGFGERGRVELEMSREDADRADVFVPGRWREIAQLDEVTELLDTWVVIVVRLHGGARVPPGGGGIALPCRANQRAR